MQKKPSVESEKDKIDFFGVSSFNLPSMGKILHSYSDLELKLIQTEKNLPVNGQYGFETKRHIQEDIQQEEDSLGQRIQKLDELKTTKKKKRSGCICKKTKCLKMYCECFSKGKMCGDDCHCCGCLNTEQNAKIVSQSRTNAKQKVSKQNRACTCKKSNCQKKYCECFSAGLSCTENCNCTDCHNSIEVTEVINVPIAQLQNPEITLERQIKANSQGFLEKSVKDLGRINEP